MAWRIVQCPNGKFALFSEVVDDFTDYDMTEIEAYELCREHMGVNDAKGKVERAKENPGRFDEALGTIQAIHGKRRAQKRRRQLSGL